jgi:hypothetical protein
MGQKHQSHSAIASSACLGRRGFLRVAVAVAVSGAAVGRVAHSPPHLEVFLRRNDVHDTRQQLG